jgi:L-lactate dehydrogenase complex protein LldG
MTSARDDILGRLRQRRPRDDAMRDATGEEIGRAIAHPERGPRPADAEDLVARFVERARAMTSSTDVCDGVDQVPARCAAWLRAMQLPLAVVVAPALADLDWRGAALSVRIGAAGRDDAVGVTPCFRAIAETGTLMLCSGPTTPAVNSLLPQTHIAIVRSEHIVADMEAAWQAARDELTAWPRAVNFVSGPSRTADIEQTIVLGAHGPYRVHVLVVGT